MARNNRQPSPLLQLTANFDARWSAVESQGIPRSHIVRSLDIGYRSAYNIFRAGVARCTPPNLLACAIAAEILGGLRSDLIVRGQLVSRPPSDLVLRSLKKLAATSPQARSFAIRRMEQLKEVRA